MHFAASICERFPHLRTTISWLPGRLSDGPLQPILALQCRCGSGLRASGSRAVECSSERRYRAETGSCCDFPKGQLGVASAGFHSGRRAKSAQFSGHRRSVFFKGLLQSAKRDIEPIGDVGHGELRVRLVCSDQRDCAVVEGSRPELLGRETPDEGASYFVCNSMQRGCVLF